MCECISVCVCMRACVFVVRAKQWSFLIKRPVFLWDRTVFLGSVSVNVCVCVCMRGAAAGFLLIVGETIFKHANPWNVSRPSSSLHNYPEEQASNFSQPSPLYIPFGR